MLDFVGCLIDVNGWCYWLLVELIVVICVDGCEYDYFEWVVVVGVVLFIGWMIE